MVFVKEFFEKVDFEKNQQTTTKKVENLPSRQRFKSKNSHTTATDSKIYIFFILRKKKTCIFCAPSAD